MAKQIRLADIDAEKESWSVGREQSIFHSVLDGFIGYSKQLSAEGHSLIKTDSKDLRCCSDLKAGSAT